MVTNFPLCAVSILWSKVEFCDRFHGSSETIVRVSSVVVTELRKSMSVLADPEGNQMGFPDGTEEFDEIMEKLEIIMNEMMADDGPMTQSDSDTSNDMSYDDV